ncbi:hypothetical protein HCA55_14450 [Listeria booriae]|uniref:Large polyvalent protein-associated domain-containing protein n=1 Tax=Listeria booriae TaxID=1552123 RepID=A0A7X0Y0H6_9LIST|nr:LPD16 domain-containing protein [Listeria booriae]MBC1794766.1 hypothetical protein [Listeria booriae]MBC1797932.1 hypothetical protein [Listeria booriae]MBC1801870.1 hypothetical protein [Listeria booriae]MBC1804118.1 hypothetical protein [Listeria booriae]MBC2037145.1 hypothetical protein [Listeria booriae]
MEINDELAMAIGDRYVSMQVCDEGFEYSIFDTDYYLQDGGIVAVPTSIIGAMYIVIQDHCMFEEPMEQIDFETLFEKTSKQELSKIEKAMKGESMIVKPSIVQTLKDTEKVPENKKTSSSQNREER